MAGDSVRGIAPPTLIVWGHRDALIPVEHAPAAHEAIAGSRLVIFEDTGHFPHCEAPERFVETLIDFVDAIEPSTMAEASWRALLQRRDAASISSPAGS